MAKNTGSGFRRGSVDNRTQFPGPGRRPTKRDASTGQIMDVKSDMDPFKGIAKEPDGRRE